jgi:formylglycine-generating enzyme required for sulfatase activity
LPFPNPPNHLTNVGAYALSNSAYGTFDQGGNLAEWNETLFSFSSRGLRGGSWISTSLELHASLGNVGDPSDWYENNQIGFRVASLIPEPSTLLLGALAGMGLLWRRRYRRD